MTSSGEKTEGSAGKGTTDHPHRRSGRCCRCLQNTQPGVMGGHPTRLQGLLRTEANRAPCVPRNAPSSPFLPLQDPASVAHFGAMEVFIWKRQKPHFLS